MKHYASVILLLILSCVSYAQEIKPSFIIRVERLDGEFSSQVGEGLIFYDGSECSSKAFYKVDTTRDNFQIKACCNYEYLEEGISDLIAKGDVKDNSKAYTPLSLTYQDDYQFSLVNENSIYYFNVVPVLADYCHCKSKGGLFYNMSLENEKIIYLKSVKILNTDYIKEYKKLNKYLKKLVRRNILR